MKLSKYFEHFFHSSKSSGILLIICVILSLLIANSEFSSDFQHLLDTKIGLTNWDIHYSISVWINDGLMAIFFSLLD